MTRSDADDGPARLQRDRPSRARPGMTLLRVWVPDPEAPAFQAAVARQSAVLRGAPEEREALDFVGDAMDWRDA